MKISTKRNIAFGLLLVLITFVVLYSHCNGNSICYTFPFLNGLEQQAVTKEKVVMTIVETKEGGVSTGKIDVTGEYSFRTGR